MVKCIYNKKGGGNTDPKTNVNLHSIYNTSQKTDNLYVYEIGTQVCRADKPVRTHVFENTTIHFVTSGEGYFDGQLIKAGEGFFVHEGELAIYKVNPDNPWTYFWINFSGTDVDRLLRHIGLEERKGVFKYCQTKKIKTIFEKAFTYDLSESDKGLMFTSYLYELLSILGYENRRINFCANSASIAEEHFNNALRFLANNYGRKITIADVAKHENIERHYLNRLFLTYSDFSPMQHLKSFRLEKARMLLRSTDLPVSIIASSVGYDDQLQFSKVFKSDTGVSPTRFRKDFYDNPQIKEEDEHP